MNSIGLVFSGGGGKGAYQIGVWRALRELGLEGQVVAVSGTSVGALNAALYLKGDLELAEQLWNSISNETLLLPSPDSADSFFSNAGLQQPLDGAPRRPSALPPASGWTTGRYVILNCGTSSTPAIADKFFWLRLHCQVFFPPLW